MTDFYQKYLKYKIKYLELKEQNGGNNFNHRCIINDKIHYYENSTQFCGKNGVENKRGEGEKCSTNGKEEHNKCKTGFMCIKKGINSYTCQKTNY
jgi:hypothetical protein